MMISIGSRVLYKTNGVCTVEAIGEAELRPGEKKTYYILSPESDRQSRIYVPVDNEQLTAQMQPMLDKEQVLSLIRSVKGREPAWIEDGKQRSLEFRGVLLRADRRELLCTARSICRRRDELTAIGKKLYAADEAVLKKAEKMLYEEFSDVLGIPAEEVPLFIEKELAE